ncbi:uncharacterized protein RMCC_5870 [Mycolicibacterium canariasense]|uniref:Uncharacterized protein n=1 Tax=Mycolicibacterium canariasense TaxID=228230 RepID=A0A100WIP9_MYCCR|nr:hypothetical protein [Mycolicibacterium canariasense]MCV7210533.1 hypothetical protein [Mycolicibacterium canariasense]ORU96131.1 hypothetical protein AWB94_31195 [Mycolicibacterium canariasense]GAS98905.1 uncharacterized protein RMCC_5870 [Mycolicibacterium canariasense]
MGQPQWIADLEAATTAAINRILNDEPPPCEHRYCKDCRFSMCMGVAGAAVDMFEDSGMSRAEAVQRVIGGLF